MQKSIAMAVSFAFAMIAPMVQAISSTSWKRPLFCLFTFAF